jgi:hypothetical protein
VFEEIWAGSDGHIGCLDLFSSHCQQLSFAADFRRRKSLLDFLTQVRILSELLRQQPLQRHLHPSGLARHVNVPILARFSKKICLFYSALIKVLQENKEKRQFYLTDSQCNKSVANPEKGQV